jgi:hypothetical protein
MTLHERIDAFDRLGTMLTSSAEPEFIVSKFWETVAQAQNVNPWFTPQFAKQAVLAIAQNWLRKDNLTHWLKDLKLDKPNPKRIGVVMAGNVPLVGFHDLLCVLISGNRLLAKVSSKDGGLMQGITNLLTSIEPRFAQNLEFTEDKLTGFDAVIATGSDSSARYFDYYTDETLMLWLSQQGDE